MRILLAVLGLLVMSLQAAASVAILGPELFRRTTGSPNTFQRQIPPANPGVDHVIVLKNGVVPADRVTSASIVLDGVEIFGPSDFNKQVAILSKTVRLRSSGSTLHISIAGGPGSFLELSVLAPFEAYTVVPATGGTVAVINPDSPIFGTAVSIPQEALPDGGVAVSIAYTDTPPAPVPGTATLASKVFELDAGGLTNFASPVAVTVPVQVAFGPRDVPVVLYWSPSEQKFKAISPKGFDRAQGLVTFETSHFSTYAVGKFDPSSVTQKVDTGFRVGVNSLRRPYSPSSNASQLAAAMYSQWYYTNKPAAEFGALFNQYVQTILPNPSDLFTSDELMFRLAVPLGAAWQLLRTAPPIPSNQAVDDLITALAVTSEPQLFLFSPAANPTLRTVGVVYSWDPPSGTFEMYLLNGGLRATLAWDSSAGSLTATVESPFPPFLQISELIHLRHIGVASLIAGPEVEGYFTSAANGWTTPPFSRITTPPDFISVQPNVVTPFSGTVQQSTNSVSVLDVLYNGEQVSTIELGPSNEYLLNYVPPAPFTNVVWLVGRVPGSPVWNDKAAFARFNVRTQECPTPFISTVSPSPIPVSPTETLTGTFEVRGANLGGSEINTTSPLMTFTGMTSVNGEGSIATRPYQIGPSVSGGGISISVANACGSTPRGVSTALQCAGPLIFSGVSPSQIPVAQVPGGTVTGTLVVTGQNLWGANITITQGRLTLTGLTIVNSAGTEARRDFINGSGIPDGEPIFIRVTGPCGFAGGFITHSNSCKTPVISGVTPNPLIGPSQPGLFNTGTFTLIGENLDNVFITTNGPLLLTSQTTTTPTSASVDYLIGCCGPTDGQVFKLFANSACGAPGASVDVTISIQP